MISTIHVCMLLCFRNSILSFETQLRIHMAAHRGRERGPRSQRSSKCTSNMFSFITQVLARHGHCPPSLLPKLLRVLHCCHLLASTIYAITATMHLKYQLLASAIFGHALLPCVVFASLTDLFHLKPGVDKGGCDALKGDLPGIFDEALVLINSATQAFTEYTIDPQVRKIALAFFGIQMNDQMTGTRDPANAAILAKVTGKYCPS